MRRLELELTLDLRLWADAHGCLAAPRGHPSLTRGQPAEVAATRPAPAEALLDGRLLLSLAYAPSFARSRSTNFWIFPVEVFGRGPKMT